MAKWRRVGEGRWKRKTFAQHSRYTRISHTTARWAGCAACVSGKL